MIISRNASHLGTEDLKSSDFPAPLQQKPVEGSLGGIQSGLPTPDLFIWSSRNIRPHLG